MCRNTPTQLRSSEMAEDMGNNFQYLNIGSKVSRSSSSCEKRGVTFKYFLLVLLLSSFTFFFFYDLF